MKLTTVLEKADVGYRTFNFWRYDAGLVPVKPLVGRGPDADWDDRTVTLLGFVKTISQAGVPLAVIKEVVALIAGDKPKRNSLLAKIVFAYYKDSSTAAEIKDLLK